MRENIETLSELEALLERTQKQYHALEQIVETHEKIVKKDHDIAVNEILLALAGRDALKQEIDDTEKDVRIKSQSIDAGKEQLEVLEQQLRDLEEQIIGINVAIQSNSYNKMVEDARRRIDDIQKELQKLQEEERRLKEQLQKLKHYTNELRNIEYTLLSSGELGLLGTAEPLEKKNAVMEKIESFQREHLEDIRNIRSRSQVECEQMTERINELQNRLRELEKRNLKYPEQTENLKQAIEREFSKRGIRSNVYILSELLEITDPKWTDAVEGYLNKQKFYLIVEPEYYDIALEVYEKRRDSIHTAGIINTKKIPLEDAVNNQSLAYVVKSENRYAKAYANYVLGRVIRCDSSKELEQHDIAITAECMLYQGYVVRHINPKNYRNPYIGQNAYRVQIVNVRKELEERSAERSLLRDRIRRYSDVLEREKEFDLSLLKLYINAPAKLITAKEQLLEAKADLDRASKDPSLIELQIQLGAVEEQRKGVIKEETVLRNENVRLELQIQNANTAISEGKTRLQELEYGISQKEDADGLAYQEADEKYKLNRKTKTAKKVAENFAPQRSQFENEKNGLVDRLKGLQQQFNLQFAEDFVVGLTGMAEYREAMQKLKSVEMIRYEEKLRQAKDDCEQIFKSDFLSKMKELIENAKTEFRNLNKALDHIYYGDDSYHFKLSFDKGKEGLYRMITSENNQEGINLWTAAFEAEYREEMTELFNKLMTKDDNGQKIVEEYTDYRSYLDYDIEIRKRDGSVQRFSDIYGEKSGSETQVPYYVAIAASFYQLYRYGNSVRLMLLDEAFDKMDDERIGSMLDFFNSLDLQVIMATPPAKIETIGEKVDTVLTAIRVGQNSIVEEYDF